MAVTGRQSGSGQQAQSRTAGTKGNILDRGRRRDRQREGHFFCQGERERETIDAINQCGQCGGEWAVALGCCTTQLSVCEYV